MTSREDTTLYLERSEVREILIGHNAATQAVLPKIDELPIFTAADIAGAAQAEREPLFTAAQVRKATKEFIQEQLALGTICLPAQCAQQPRLAERLTDVILMLDTPDAYNREYIAAVCRSILSSVPSTPSAPAQAPSDLARRHDAEMADVTGQLFDALNEIRTLKAHAQAAANPALPDRERMAEILYTAAHKGLRNCWKWSDGELDHEHPTSRGYWYKIADGTLSALSSTECNLPFERLPQHAGDPGFGPVPNVVPIGSSDPNHPSNIPEHSSTEGKTP